MSHFDDIDFVIWGGPIGFLGLLIVVLAVLWAAKADDDSRHACASHGETYLDSRAGYTLCEQDGGTVVHR